jgi:serine/threonine protein kinase
MFLNETSIRKAAEQSKHVGVLFSIRGDGQRVGDKSKVYYMIERPFQNTLKEKYQPGQSAELSDLIRISWQASDAIAAGHMPEKPIIHSDIKDANIGLTETGDVRVFDYGISRLIRETTKVVKLTKRRWVGAIDTSPAELYSSKRGMPNKQTDVAMLGAVMYKLATGWHPFSPKKIKPSMGEPGREAYESETIENKLADDYSHIFAGLIHLPIEVAMVITKAMARDPNNRYKDASELARELAVLANKDKAYNGIKEEVLEAAKTSKTQNYLHPHLKRTEDWLLILNPSASYAQRTAAISHDFERITKDRVRKGNNEPYDQYKFRHATHAAKVVENLAHRYTTDAKFIDELRFYVQHHDDKKVTSRNGFSRQLQEVVDADSLSFFQVNFEGYETEYKSEPKRMETKVHFMYHRMSPKARSILHKQSFFEKAKPYLK